MPKPRTMLSVMACIVIACPTLGATNSYDGTYSGERSVTTGAAPYCAERESVSVIITGSTLKFTNSEWRDLLIRFNLQADGSFGGALEDPAGHVVDVQGEATGTAIDADVLNYGTGCGHHWHLEKSR